MAQYRHILSQETISFDDYLNLSSTERCYYEKVSNDDFIVSAIIGNVTDSAILGGLLGGSVEGGLLGDVLDGDLFD